MTIKKSANLDFVLHRKSSATNYFIALHHQPLSFPPKQLKKTANSNNM